MPPIPKTKKPDSCNGYKLAREIVARSEADSWDRAKLEWQLDVVYLSDEFGECLCGHYPIREHCILINVRNGNEAVVGNVCVDKFLGLSSGKLFAAFHRIADDPERSLNAEAIDYCFRNGWMTEWEREFYFDTMRKRRLSPRQRAKRVEINESVLFSFRRS